MLFVFSVGTEGQMFLYSFWKEDERLPGDMVGFHYCVGLTTYGSASSVVVVHVMST